MKKAIKSSTSWTVNARKLAEAASEALWEFQEGLSGPPELSDALEIEDIETLDAAQEVLAHYIEVMKTIGQVV